MATLWITEYTRLAYEGSGASVLVGKEPSKTQTLAIVGASGASTAFRADTRFVRMHTDTACYVGFGDAPVATSGSMRMAANQTEFFGVVGGHAVAVLIGA